MTALECIRTPYINTEAVRNKNTGGASTNVIHVNLWVAPEASEDDSENTDSECVEQRTDLCAGSLDKVGLC